MRKCCIEEINEIAQLRKHTNDSIINSIMESLVWFLSLIGLVTNNRESHLQMTTTRIQNALYMTYFVLICD